MNQRSILVTGASTGIGLATARALKIRGWRVLATARKPADLDRLATNEQLEVLPLELTDEGSIAACAEEALRRTEGKLTALYNNAAYGVVGAMEDISAAVLRRHFEANVIGTHDLTRRIIPAMRTAGTGRIVMCSSVLGFVSEGEGGVSLPPMRLTLRLNGTLWPGIELTAGATTEVDPAVVGAVNLDVGGLDIVDVETGAKLTELSAGASQAALAPGRYGLSQNGVVGRTLDLLAGDRVTITLGTLILVGGDPVQHVVRNARGEQVAILWDAQPLVSLLAGTYTVGEGDNASVVTVREGKTSEVTLK